jgi:hypothetical protein
MSVPATSWTCSGNLPGPKPCCIHEKRTKEPGSGGRTLMAYRCCHCNDSATTAEQFPPLPDPYPPGTQHGPLQLGWPARRK